MSCRGVIKASSGEFGGQGEVSIWVEAIEAIRESYGDDESSV